MDTKLDSQYKIVKLTIVDRGVDEYGVYVVTDYGQKIYPDSQDENTYPSIFGNILYPSEFIFDFHDNEYFPRIIPSGILLPSEVHQIFSKKEVLSNFFHNPHEEIDSAPQIGYYHFIYRKKLSISLSFYCVPSQWEASSLLLQHTNVKVGIAKLFEICDLERLLTKINNGGVEYILKRVSEQKSWRQNFFGCFKRSALV